MTNYVISHHIRNKLVKALADTINYMVEKCQFPASIGSWPIKIVNKFFEGGELVGSGSEAAGFISGFCFYFSLMFTASALFVEKINGATDRYKVTGTTFIEIVTGHLVIQLLLLTIQKTIMLSIIYGGFGYLFNGSVSLVYLGLYLIEFVGISLGIFLSVVTDVTFTINLLIIFFTLAMFLLGGVGWPEDAMHWLLHIYKWTVPAQPAMSSLRHVIIRNENLTSPNVYVGYSVCILWIALITLCTYVVIKIKNR